MKKSKHSLTDKEEPLYLPRFKFGALCLFCLIDLFINGIADYGVPETMVVSEEMKQKQGLLFMIQLLVQLSSLSVLILLTFETYPFQVGFYQWIIVKCYRGAILVVLYFILTCIVGSIRLIQIKKGINIGTLWSSVSYATLSTVHKLGA
jgi:hypothetical protein